MYNVVNPIVMYILESDFFEKDDKYIYISS